MNKFTGTITYQVFAQGTKSESERPYLITEKGDKILLYKKNDNPFENRGFSAYAGRQVVLEGELVNGVLHVETVELIEAAPAAPATDPAAGTAEKSEPAQTEQAPSAKEEE